ncbi:MAG TPA: hypothetical protein VHS31_02165, partial [Tepidisphaeraceae bacterium]|nr:hypothetical protein [Tepidisphaeraceae bacterium]
ESSLRKVLLLILHDHVHCPGLAIRHDANGTTVHASLSETFKSPAFDRLQERRRKLDPFMDKQVETGLAIKQLNELSANQQKELIDLLAVECLTAHLQRPTELVQILTDELKVNLREHWRPHAEWLSGYQKVQLSLLLTELLGKVHTLTPERKKSELVSQLDKLFADAASGKQPDKKLADKLNAWLPANMRKGR